MPELIRRDPSWIDNAPVQVEESITIDAPPDVVWGLVADHERWPEWFSALASVEITLGATGVGGGRKVKAGPMGPMVFDEEFTAWDDPADDGTWHFAFTVLRSNVPLIRSMAESVRLSPIGDGARTLLVYRQGLEAPQPWLTGALGLSWRYAEWGLRRALPALAARAEQLASDR